MKICLLFILSLCISVVYSAIPLPADADFGTSKNITIKSKKTKTTYHFKQSTLCDSVVQYSGYIDVTPTTHYFFWFFESRENPETAPVTLWLNGGPGCSSLTGLWQEVGPCYVNDNGTKDLYNERGSWNKITNMLFIDQPAGAGYSYGDLVSSTEEATPLLHKFLLKFFDAFPEYRPNPFHFFGESYAGHYIPSMANYILKKNKGLSKKNRKYINLQSIGIGNGLTSIVTQDQYSVTMACNSSYGSVLNKTSCDLMARNTPKCIQRMEKCKKTGKIADCTSATNYCAKYVENIYRRSGQNIYDIRSKDAPPLTFINFISQDKIKELIGVPTSLNFNRCNKEVKTAFYGTGDYARDFAPFVAKILNQGIPVLIFAGDADYRGHWYGNHAWTQKLKFKKSSIYQSRPLYPLFLDQNGAEIGESQSGGGLTFVRIFEAGHKAAYYQPEAVYDMFYKFINGEFLK
ncbi:unnamed protein product [Cunninghamella blakesleeana]